ncbi:unnamed protein product [Sympodiomycopsis kandeliae]
MTNQDDGQDPSPPEASSAHLVYSKSRVTLHPTPYSKDNIAGYLCLLRPDTSNEIHLSWLPESIISKRNEHGKFVDVELREAEGLESRGEVEQDSEQEQRVISISEIIDQDCILIDDGHQASSKVFFTYPIGQIHSVGLIPPTVTNWYGSLNIHLRNGNEPPRLYFHDDESRRIILDMIKASKSSDTTTPSPSSNGHPSSSSFSTSSSSSSSVSSGSYPPQQPRSKQPVWGGEELLQHLRKYVNIQRSVHDHNLFLLDPSRQDLEFHSMPVFADDALEPKQQRQQQSDQQYIYPEDPLAPLSGSSSSHIPNSLSSWRSTLLSSFSQVTRQARETSRQILAHPAARPYKSKLPMAVQSFANAGPLGPFSSRIEEVSQRAGVTEYDSARVYLAKWAKLVAEEGQRNKRQEQQEQLHSSSIASGAGGDPLGIFSNETMAKCTRSATEDPITPTEWQAWFDQETGRPTVTVEEMKSRVFARNVVSDLRREVWPFLLGVIPWNTTRDEREKVWQCKKEEYEIVKNYTRTIGSEREDVVDQFHRIHVDCRRVDRKMPLFKDEPVRKEDEQEQDKPVEGADHIGRLEEVVQVFTFYDAYGPQASDSDLSSHKLTDSELGGYVQGMSDLCSTLYVISEGNCSETFSLFTALMNPPHNLRNNFDSSQEGMTRQLLELQTLLSICDPQLYSHFESTDSLNLFFCFRWILVIFKREFTSNFNSLAILWESIFSIQSIKTSNLTIWIALWILISNRSQVIEHLTCFDEVLQYFQSLHLNDPFECVLGAERCVVAVREWVRNLDVEGKEEDRIRLVRGLFTT